jgi:cytosine/adenosine deaminase-related metal-dependent hydrolase
MRIHAARHLLPVSAPPISDGAVAVDAGRIITVGTRSDVVAAHPQAELDDRGDAVLIPGLINAHAHLELSWMAGKIPQEVDYVGWVRALIDLRTREDEEVARAAAARSIETLVARGTVAIGDVANGSWIVPMLADSGLHARAFHEILGFRSRDAETILQELAGRLETIGRDKALASCDGRVRVVPSPHAPHTTSPSILRALAGRARASGEPLSVHVAESAAECRLLADGSGAFRELLEERGQLEEGWQPPRRTPIAHLHHLGVLGEYSLAVHCVHLEAQDHSLLQSTRATVVTCPRSNRRLGVGVAPVPQLLREGIPIALGTDSLASSPDLDILAEIAALRSDHPGIAPAAALRMATLNGARALGLERELGSIETGKRALLVAVALGSPADDPLETVSTCPQKVWPLAAGESYP